MKKRRENEESFSSFVVTPHWIRQRAGGGVVEDAIRLGRGETMKSFGLSKSDQANLEFNFKHFSAIEARECAFA